MADRGNGAASHEPAHGAASPSAPSAGAAPHDTLDLKERLDRFGAILARGLDLAEAGLSLGLTIVSTVGTAAQQKILERMLEPGPEPPPDASLQTPPPPAQAEPPPYGVTNRLPLWPGGSVSVSFSINNDSPFAPKNVTLRADAFIGDRTGAVLPLDFVRVVPESVTIAPMDFEKFLLQGAIPSNAGADVYRGSVAVESESRMSIPVWLVVESAASA